MIAVWRVAPELNSSIGNGKTIRFSRSYRERQGNFRAPSEAFRRQHISYTDEEYFLPTNKYNHRTATIFNAATRTILADKRSSHTLARSRQLCARLVADEQTLKHIVCCRVSPLTDVQWPMVYNAIVEKNAQQWAEAGVKLMAYQPWLDQRRYQGTDGQKHRWWRLHDLRLGTCNDIAQPWRTPITR